MKFLLDTCAIIWLVSEPEKISAETLDKLVLPFAKVSISAISIAEIACAQERNRIQIDRHWKTWIQHYVKLNDWNVLAVDWKVFEEGWSLPGDFHSDPADRIIVATARVLDTIVVTGDSKLLSYPHVSAIN